MSFAHLFNREDLLFGTLEELRSAHESLSDCMPEAADELAWIMEEVEAEVYRVKSNIRSYADSDHGEYGECD